MSMEAQNGSHRIKANIMRMATLEPKTDNREVLKQYLVSERGTIELTEKQQELLERAEEADRLMRERKYTRLEMEQMLANKFGYSLNTARNDLYMAEDIWGNAHRRNKGYLMSGHIDLIDELLKDRIEKKDWKTIPVLLAERTKAIKELPEHNTTETTPAAIIFNFGAGMITDLLGEEMSMADAQKAASSYLGKDIEDINHEEVDE